MAARAWKLGALGAVVGGLLACGGMGPSPAAPGSPPPGAPVATAEPAAPVARPGGPRTAGASAPGKKSLATSPGVPPTSCHGVNPASLKPDFSPPSGRLAGAKKESPGLFRILGATSLEGLVFTPLRRVISDQANVPSVVADANGTLFLYYTAGRLANVVNALGVAISADKGQSWTHKLVQVAGSQTGTPVDPDVVVRPDGTFRIYYTGGRKEGPGISYADSTDGLHFTYKGLAFAPPGGAMDCTVYQVGSTWHMLALDVRGEPRWHATSPDGAIFTPATPSALRAGRIQHIASNPIALATGTRMYAFHILTGVIGSFVSTDGTTWVEEPGVRIPRDPASKLEGPYLKDAAVARLPDGSYFAAYVTPIP